MQAGSYEFHPDNSGGSQVLTIATATIPGTELTAENATPLDYFLHSYGPASSATMHLGWAIVGLLAVVFLIVLLLLLVAMFRKRPAEEPILLGPEEEGLSWIYIGTAISISTGLLLVLTIYSLSTLNAIAKPAETPALTVTVTGYDWWWKVEYENDDPSQRFVTANEIHIPVGRPVLVKLKSADVIHAFWVPTLAGKTQMIPGQINQQWLQADSPGIYRGQCTQYCGAQHAHMGLEVVAQAPEEFQKWQESQRRPFDANATVHHTGKDLFMDHCAGCHSIRGSDAVGAHAPDLTHLRSRRLIASGLLSNTPEHLAEWVNDAQALKPGSRMPSMMLTAAELSAVTAFLSTLD